LALRGGFPAYGMKPDELLEPLSLSPQASRSQNSPLISSRRKDPSILTLKEFSKEILDVTGAEVDVPREVYFHLSARVYPSLKGNEHLRGLWNALWEDVSEPESLLSREQINKDIKKRIGNKTLLTEHQESFEEFKEALLKISQSKDELLRNTEAEKVLSSEDLDFFRTHPSSLEGFYTSYLTTTLDLINTYIKTSDFSIYTQLSERLGPKALMLGDLMTKASFFRIPQSIAQDMLSLGERSPSSGRRSGTSNHKVTSLPKGDNDKPRVYFKRDGHPSLKPGKEAMVYHLYESLSLPIPATNLLILDNIKTKDGYNKEPYVLQASQAIHGPNAKEILLSDSLREATLNSLDKDLYTRQVIGALLTDPSDGKPDNFIYEENLKSFISVDNDEVLEETLKESKEGKRVHLKSMLYTLPLMNEKIPSESLASFLTLLPEIRGLSFLKALEKRNRAYTHLFTELKFLDDNAHRKGIQLKRKESGLPESYLKNLFATYLLPIDIDPFCFHRLLTHLNKINERLQQAYASQEDSSLTFQDLFNEVHPLIGPYYQKLRETLPNPYQAIEALYGIAPSESKDYTLLSSLIEEEQNILSFNLSSAGSSYLDLGLSSSQIKREKGLQDSLLSMSMGSLQGEDRSYTLIGENTSSPSSQEHFPLGPINTLKNLGRKQRDWVHSLSLETIMQAYLQQWEKGIFRGHRLLKDLKLLPETARIQARDTQLFRDFWRKGSQKFKEQESLGQGSLEQRALEQGNLDPGTSQILKKWEERMKPFLSLYPDIQEEIIATSLPELPEDQEDDKEESLPSPELIHSQRTLSPPELKEPSSTGEVLGDEEIDQVDGISSEHALSPERDTHNEAFSSSEILSSGSEEKTTEDPRQEDELLSLSFDPAFIDKSLFLFSPSFSPSFASLPEEVPLNQGEEQEHLELQEESLKETVSDSQEESPRTESPRTNSLEEEDRGSEAFEPKEEEREFIVPDYNQANKEELEDNETKKEGLESQTLPLAPSPEQKSSSLSCLLEEEPYELLSPVPQRTSSYYNSLPEEVSPNINNNNHTRDKRRDPSHPRAKPVKIRDALDTNLKDLIKSPPLFSQQKERRLKEEASLHNTLIPGQLTILTYGNKVINLALLKEKDLLSLLDSSDPLSLLKKAFISEMYAESPFAEDLAMELYEKAGEKGILEAYNNLGWMHEMGRGTQKRNLYKASACYKKLQPSPKGLTISPA
jgi:hypothetical protein